MPRLRIPSSNFHFFLSFALVTAVSLPASAMDAAQPVSPGDPRSIPTVEARCPTFSWTESEGAEGYELVIFELSEGEEGSSVEALEPALETLTDTRPSVRVDLPDKASSWTPSGERCLESGKSYAWALRALRALAPGHDAEWSEAYLFEVETAPAAIEVREALETLERYLEQGGNPTVPPAVAAAPGTSSITAQPPVAHVPIPSLSSVALTAELADTASATGGVKGVSNSASGIAGVFQNTNAAGTVLSGQNATDEVFKVDGSGAVTATSFFGVGTGLTGVGGGTGVVAAFAVSDDLAELPAAAVFTTVLSTTITAPSAGVLLIGATVDVTNFATADTVECRVQVGATPVVGSHMFTSLDGVGNANEEEDCTTVAAVGVGAPGAFPLNFQVLIGADVVNTKLFDGTLWVLWAPASPP